MSQCPVCSSPIEDSFGLIECPGCHKVLFADFDGALKVHEENAEESDSKWDLDRSTHALENLDPVLEPEVEASPVPIAEVESEPESFLVEDAVIEEVVEVVEAPVEMLNEPTGDLSAIEQINQFASSEDSLLKQGALIYNLTIRNIDTEDLKREILDILKENKLNIDVKKLKFALPTLELEDLNPVKVSVIVSRIKHLPVEVEWGQRSAVIDKESDID